MVSYEVDENHLDARSVAARIGVDAAKVFKTLVCRGDRTGVCVFCVPGDRELDLKKAAQESGNRKIAPASLRELQPLTGYIRGGCSPFGMKRNYPTFLDQSALVYDRIFVSGGARGIQIQLDPQALLKYTGAALADLV